MHTILHRKFPLPKNLNSKIVEVDGVSYEKQPSGAFFIEINLEKSLCLCGDSIENMCSFFGKESCNNFYPKCRKENVFYREIKGAISEQGASGVYSSKSPSPKFYPKPQ